MLLTCQGRRTAMAKIYSLKKGAVIPDAIVAIAQSEGVKSASIQSIGGVESLKLGYYNSATKKYEEHSYEEFMEVTGLIGNIALKDGKPFLHAHGTFGRRDGTVVGGHLLTARVSPLLEVVVEPTLNEVKREFDEDTGLYVIK